MLNTNFNAFFVPHQLIYPYGYQYLILPQSFPVQNQQHYYTQTQIQENKSSIEPNHSIEVVQYKTYSETESKLDSTSNHEEIKEIHVQTKLKKNNLLKKSQKPNYLVKSTNIQKNYAKAIVSFAYFGRNKSTRVSEINEPIEKQTKEYSPHHQIYSSRGLFEDVQDFRQQLFEKRLCMLYLQFQNPVEELSCGQQDYSQEFSTQVLRSHIIKLYLEYYSISNTIYIHNLLISLTQQIDYCLLSINIQVGNVNSHFFPLILLNRKNYVQINIIIKINEIINIDSHYIMQTLSTLILSLEMFFFLLITCYPSYFFVMNMYMNFILKLKDALKEFGYYYYQCKHQSSISQTQSLISLICYFIEITPNHILLTYIILYLSFRECYQEL